MKKVITVCLCLIVALSALSVACAEDFTIHAGTMFGDTKAQVMEKETLELYKEEAEDDYINLIYEGTIAGCEDCFIRYYFDKEQELYEAKYNMGSHFDIGNDGILNRYAKLYDALKEKYGEPVSTDDEAYFLMLGDCVYPKSQMYDYNWVSWIIPYETYNVKIDLVLSNYKGKSDYYCNIDYYTFTDEVLETAKKVYEEANKINNDDL